MKKLAALVLAGLTLAGGAGVYASGGTAADPLVSLGYLNRTYVPDAAQQATGRVDTRMQAVYQSVLDDLTLRHSGYLAQAGGSAGTAAALPGSAPATAEQRLKRGDVVSLSTGSAALLLAGNAVVACAPGGAAVDVTAGQVLASGGELPRLHRVLAAEQTTAAVTVTSDTAVLSVQGGYTLSPSGSVDYYALADALQSMGLFRGTGTAYGSGYDLEEVPTRIVGLVMFLRLIGAESAALAYGGVNPFGDTPAWCDRYVAYAYAMGYTKGVGNRPDGTLIFQPDSALSGAEYMTFLLRALGYQDSGGMAEFSWSTALSFALERGVINSAEYMMLSGGTFLRGQVVYLSVYALSAPRRDGSGTLADHLAAQGGVDEAALYTALYSVARERLGG